MAKKNYSGLDDIKHEVISRFRQWVGYSVIEIGQMVILQARTVQMICDPLGLVLLESQNCVACGEIYRALET